MGFGMLAWGLAWGVAWGLACRRTLWIGIGVWHWHWCFALAQVHPEFRVRKPLGARDTFSSSPFCHPATVNRLCLTSSALFANTLCNRPAHGPSISCDSRLGLCLHLFGPRILFVLWFSCSVVLKVHETERQTMSKFPCRLLVVLQ